MFFDCTALICGLVASIITRWQPNERFTYGYVRAEVIAGFVNGLFLLFIAFFIFSEAVERSFEPPEVKHERLFIISVLGLLVNLVGIFVFQHGGGHHGHSHGAEGDSHGHSHSSNSNSHSHHDSHYSSNNPLLNSFNSSNHSFVTESHNHSHHSHNHNHSHDHHHSHTGTNTSSHRQIMQGVFLHILADTLGSVGVIISAILMNQFGWMIADPICSMFIATLVALSVYPLLRDSVSIIMQRSPKELDNQLASVHQKITTIDGVYSLHDFHIWTLCTDSYVASLRVEVARNTDYGYIQNMIRSIFSQLGVKNVYIEVNYAAT